MTDGRPSSAQRAGDSERKEELGKRRERPIWTMRNQLQLKREGGRTKERVKSERTGGKTSSAMHEVDGQEAAAPLKKKMKKDTKQTCQLPPGHRFLRRQVASLCHAEGLRGRLILSLSLLLQLLHLLLPILLLEMTFEGQASQLNRTWTNLPHRNATSPNLTFHLTWLGLTQNPEAILNAYDLIHPVLSCPVLSCPVLSCPVHSCPVLPCPVLSFQFMFTQSNVVHSTIWKKNIHCSSVRVILFGDAELLLGASSLWPFNGTATARWPVQSFQLCVGRLIICEWRLPRSHTLVGKFFRLRSGKWMDFPAFANQTLDPTE